MYSQLQLEKLESYLEHLNTKGDLPYYQLMLPDPNRYALSDTMPGRLRSIDRDLDRLYHNYHPDYIK